MLYGKKQKDRIIVALAEKRIENFENFVKIFRKSSRMIAGAMPYERLRVNLLEFIPTFS
ncbi:hypothetical protein [Peribacillus simplex]|uniref:hypothetical protein n=1 Tax=Peribacillus simplex TaxID=1478 RepID=UPI003D29E8A8